MDTTVLIVIIVLLLIALAAAGVILSRRRKSEQLQDHFGPEYERSLKETGDRKKAEAQLSEREKRVRELDIRDLRPEERDRFSTSWADIQRGFVDDPVQSVRSADALVVDIMRTRGYPVDDFERRAEDISVEHPNVVHHYREARAVREATDHGTVDTDQQRHAVTSYRSLVEELLGSRDGTDDRSDRRDDDRDDHRDEHRDHRRDDRRDDDRGDDRRIDDHVDSNGRTDSHPDRSADSRGPVARAADALRGDRDAADTDRHVTDSRPVTDRPNREEHTR